MRPSSILMLFAIAVSFGCKKRDDASGEQSNQSGSTAGEVALSRAESIYAERCASCHGIGGRGDGPIARSLNPKPRDYSSSAWQRSVTDKQIGEIIVKGGGALGKSPVMPASPDLANDPSLLKAMVAKIRRFEQK